MIKCRTLKVAHDLRDLIEHEFPQEDITTPIVGEGRDEDIQLALRLTYGQEFPRTGIVTI